jgi:hypothetical protein
MPISLEALGRISLTTDAKRWSIIEALIFMYLYSADSILYIDHLEIKCLLRR